MNMLSVASALAIAATLFLAGCASPAQSEPARFRTLAKGAFSGITEPKTELIKTESEWEKLWAKHNSISNPSDKRPKVDFRKEMVVAITMGQQRTGGYEIEVLDVVKADNRLKITYKRTTPDPGAISIQVLTAPFHFIAVPRTDLKPEFAEVNKR